MTNMKSMMLAAVTALTLTAGAAMAQEGGGPSYTGVDFWAPQNQAAAQVSSAAKGHDIQYGSSDVTLDPGMHAYLQYNPYLGN